MIPAAALAAVLVLHAAGRIPRRPAPEQVRWLPMLPPVPVPLHRIEVLPPVPPTRSELAWLLDQPADVLADGCVAMDWKFERVLRGELA